MVEYFSHDFHSRHDPKLQKLLRTKGLQGIGIFWCIVEFCYEQGGIINKSEIESIAFDMRTECERIAEVLRDFDLFDFDGEQYTSKSITKRIDRRKEISEKASKSAEIRWKNANAMRTQCGGNALKKRKEKKRKENIPPDSPVDSRFQRIINRFCEGWKVLNNGKEYREIKCDVRVLKAFLIDYPDITVDMFFVVVNKSLSNDFHKNKTSLRYVCSNYSKLELL